MDKRLLAASDSPSCAWKKISLFTIDEVVFGEPGDMTLLGARTLEGLSLMVDSRKKKLVAAGPLPAA